MTTLMSAAPAKTMNAQGGACADIASYKSRLAEIDVQADRAYQHFVAIAPHAPTDEAATAWHEIERLNSVCDELRGLIRDEQSIEHLMVRAW